MFASKPTPAMTSSGSACTSASAGVEQSAHALDRDADRDDGEQHAVDERGQHLDPLEAERVPVGGRPGGDDGRDQGDGQADRVARHVTGVGEQGERAREQRADDLGDQHGDDDRERDREAGAVRSRTVRVIVAHGIQGMCCCQPYRCRSTCDQRAERPRAVADRVLLVGGEQRARAVEPVGTEHRVVAESVLALGRLEHRPRPDAELDVLVRRRRRGRRRSRTSPRRSLTPCEVRAAGAPTLSASTRVPA